MTKKEHRLAIIKDVLTQLKKLKVKEGRYCEGPTELKEGGLKEQIKKLRKCEVCAKGALFLSYIDVYNKIDIEDIDYCIGDDYVDVSESTISQYLCKYFTQNQLDLIEVAFEGCDPNYRVQEKYIEKAVDFGYKYSRPRERLKAILLNMLENDTIFKP